MISFSLFPRMASLVLHILVIWGVKAGQDELKEHAYAAFSDR